MDLNFNNYAYLNEQEMRQEDEKQTKEIQALLINEFDGIELDEDDENDKDYNNENDSCDVSQNEDNLILRKTLEEEDSRYEIENTSSDSNDKENKFMQPYDVMNNMLPNWNCVTPFAQFYNVMPTNHKQNFQFKFPQTNNNCISIDDSSINWEISLHDEMGVPTSTSNNQIFPDKPAYSISSNAESRQFLPPENRPKVPIKISTRDVAVECIPASQRELDNLELLYASRGKRIEQLQLELDSEREKRLKENRICNHKIILLESEQKNESNIKKRALEDLDEHRRIISDNDIQIQKQNDHIMQLESEIHKLKDKLESCEIVIEGLNEQLMDLTSNTAMSRNNHKQAELLDCINRQFDTDSHRLKAEIQRMSERVDEKMKEIVKLESLLDDQTENHRIQNHEWETQYDKLLEEFKKEKEYRKELEYSVSQDKINQLNDEISDLKLGKSLAEDMNDYFQEKVMELNHQLGIFEQSLNLLSKDDQTNTSFFSEDREMDNIRNSCPCLPMAQGFMKNKLDNLVMKNDGCDLRKQIFVLIARTTSLTNRLLDVRKENLESKANTKKLHKTIEDQKTSKQLIQTKLIEVENRLKELEFGEETSTEKQLKMSIQSIEIVKDNLEQQCKTLQNQLKQATDSMKELDKSYNELNEEFLSYRQVAEEEKLSSIEDVKRACNVHYENLREKLEQCWMAEKETLVELERNHKDKLLHDLSDAVKEVDRVKNLYIHLSQQKSDEELDRSNWHDWLEKKLEEQKRSLNQQFRKDQEAHIIELEKKHELEMEQLLTGTDRKVPIDDKCEGTVCPLLVDKMCSYQSFGTEEKYVQMDGSQTDSDEVHELTLTNDRLQSSLNEYHDKYTALKIEYDSLESIKLTIEKEYSILSSEMNVIKGASSLPFEDKHSPVISRNPEYQTSIPNIIRSTTPQLVLGTKRNNNVPTELSIRTSNIQNQFRELKEELVLQLSQVSQALQLDNNVSTEKFSQSQHILPSFIDSGSSASMESIKEQLYSFVLQTQARAASALQHELRKSQIIVRRSLLEQLKQVIPISLSVDGQMMDIHPTKIKILVDKIILTLDHLEGNPTSNNHSHSRVVNNVLKHSHPFSKTSTPRNSRSFTTMPLEPPVFITNPLLEDSTDSWNSSVHSHISDTANMNLIERKRAQLRDEIVQLSDALNLTNTQPLTPPIQNPFDNVDSHWLCSSPPTLVKRSHNPTRS